MAAVDPNLDLERLYEQSIAMDADPEWAAARAGTEPQKFYAGLAAKGPVAFAGTGTMVLLRMEDILFVNKSRDCEQASKFLGSNRPAIPLGLDGPEHVKYRRLLDPVFTAKRVAPLADQVRATAHEMIDGFIHAHRVDAYRDWCEPLPSTIFLSIMGLPMEDLPGFLNFKNLTLGNEQVERDSPEVTAAKKAEAVQWIQGYFDRAIDARQAAETPGDDMLGWLIEAEAGGEKLSREDLHDILGLLIIAGLDTVAASLACFLAYFAQHPEQRARMVADPSGWPRAVEELMRYESPVTNGGRIALDDLVLPSGVDVKAGAMMIASWSAANLDPAYFPSPLTVDLDRSPNPHIGFASGFHRCLGSHLARMEMVVAMEVWHERIPDYQVQPGFEVTYSGNPRAPHNFLLVWE
jgi:cytochrome P450